MKQNNNNVNEEESQVNPLRQIANYAMEKKYSHITPIFKQLVTDRIQHRKEVMSTEIGANLFGGK